jgi:hypothetical protein
MVKISLSRLDMETKRLERPHFKNYTETYVSVTATATTTLDVSLGNVFDLSQATSITTLNITNIPVSGTVCNITIIRTHDTSYNSYTISWPVAFKWPGGVAPTLTQFLDSVDIINAVTKDGGTTWYAFSGGLNTYDSSLFDPYFKNTVLLLKAPGANGKQNNNASTDFVDSSTNNFTVTRNGGGPGMTQGTFSPFSQTGWSAYFDGTSYLTAPSSASFAFGTADFTVEFWLYTPAFPASTAYHSYFSTRVGGLGLDIQLLNNAGTYNLMVGDNAGSIISVNNSFTTNVQTHIAAVRQSGVFYLYVNGVSVAFATASRNFTDNGCLIAAGVGGANKAIGYISNVRVCNGKAVYPSGTTFNPSTSPLTSTSQGATNCELLTLQSNRFFDANTTVTAKVISIATGTPSIQPFSPFAPVKSYSTSLIGGSAYFDGTGDYLTVADSANLEIGAVDFTIECWFYPLVAPNQAPLLGKVGNMTVYGSWCLYFVGAGSLIPKLSMGSAGSSWDMVSAIGTLGVTLNAWNHIAINRTGSAITLWINGVSSGTATSSSATYNGTTNFSIGASSDGTNISGAGYISGVRLVTGTGVYPNAFTPPTAPFTAITNTQLLLNFTNAGIVDYASGNDLETIGNAQASTTITKFSKSMKFDGAGDYLFRSSPGSLSTVLRSGDFTVELWFYNTSAGVLIDTRSAGGSTTGWVITCEAVGTISVYTGAYIVSSYAMASSTWHHIAYCRASGTHNVFFDGVSIGTSSLSRDFTDTNFCIGANSYSQTEVFTGYIEDLRITKGVARYLGNFTPPTVTLPLQ